MPIGKQRVDAEGFFIKLLTWPRRDAGAIGAPDVPLDTDTSAEVAELADALGSGPSGG